MTPNNWTCHACKSVQVDGEDFCANEDCPSHERYECAECGATDHPSSECPELRSQDNRCSVCCGPRGDEGLCLSCDEDAIEPDERARIVNGVTVEQNGHPMFQPIKADDTMTGEIHYYGTVTHTAYWTPEHRANCAHALNPDANP